MLRQIVASPISELALRSTRDLTVRKIFKISSVVARESGRRRAIPDSSEFKGEFTRFALRSIALDESRKAGSPLDGPFFIQTFFIRTPVCANVFDRYSFEESELDNDSPSVIVQCD